MPGCPAVSDPGGKASFSGKSLGAMGFEMVLRSRLTAQNEIIVTNSQTKRCRPACADRYPMVSELELPGGSIVWGSRLNRA
jgi:hypothetical protein